MELLDAVEQVLTGIEQARALKNRGIVHYWRGDFALAAATLEAACRALRRHGDRTGEARARVTLGAVLWTGSGLPVRRAAPTRGNQGRSRPRPVTPSASAHQNLGYLAMLQRDLPRAIAEFESPSLGTSPPRAHGYLPDLHTDHAQALAAAGLFDDAEMLARRAIDMLAKDGNEIEMAGARGDSRRDPSRPAGSRWCAGRGGRRCELVPQAGSRAGGWRSRGVSPCRPRRGTRSRRANRRPARGGSRPARRGRARRRGDRSRLVAALARIGSSATMPDDPFPPTLAGGSQRTGGGPHPARPRRRPGGRTAW